MHEDGEENHIHVSTACTQVIGMNRPVKKESGFFGSSTYVRFLFSHKTKFVAHFFHQLGPDDAASTICVSLTTMNYALRHIDRVWRIGGRWERRRDYPSD